MAVWKRIVTFIWTFILAIVGFCIGLTCSLLLYEFALRETDFNDAYKVLIFLSIAIFLSLGFALSTQLACITLLTLPEFVGRAGRRSIQATILILVLAGPLKNLGENGEETLRFFICIKDMLWDIFMAGVDLVLAPVQHILLDLKGIPGRSAKLEEAFAILPTASESERVRKTYQKTLMARCEEIFNKGTQSCIAVFQNKHADCTETVGEILAWVLCWPMKLEFVCNVLSDFSMDKTCNEVEGFIDGNFVESYTFVKTGIDDFTKSFQFRINYQGLTDMINLDSVKQKRDEMLEQFLESKKYVEWYLTMIKRSLTLSYLLVLFSALTYHKNYFAKLSFDNVYLSSYFRKIDRRRYSSSKTTLLPLKSFERVEVTPLVRFWLTKPEWAKFGNQLFGLALQTGVVFSIFALDHIFKELLELLKNHAQIEIKQEGIHVLAIQITGEGFLAQLMRRIVADFSVRKEIDMSHFTKPCLPIPKETNPSYYQRILILFLVLLANAYFEAHFSRLRHCIADFFFNKRYKKRTVWLYNELLRRRQRKLSHLKRKALENGEKFKTFMPLNPFQLLAHYFPRRCAWLQRWKVGRKKCLLCLANGSIYNCPRCGFAYCAECFNDVKQQCLYCEAKREEEENQRWEWEENVP